LACSSRSTVHSIWLAFLAWNPSPPDALGLGEKRLAAFVKGHRDTNRKTVAHLLKRLRSALGGRGGEIETRTRRLIVLGLIRTLQDADRADRRVRARDRAGAGHSPRRGDLRSFVRSPDSVLCAATRLAEIGDSRGRYRHRDAIAADAGLAPVVVQSGNPQARGFRWACNKRLRRALETLAMSTRQWPPWPADRYTLDRARRALSIFDQR
jgi:transposase